MVEQKKRLIAHNYYSKSVKGEAGEGSEGPRIGLTVVIDDTEMTNGQLCELLDILDRAVADANAVMGW